MCEFAGFARASTSAVCALSSKYNHRPDDNYNNPNNDKNSNNNNNKNNDTRPDHDSRSDHNPRALSEHHQSLQSDVGRGELRSERAILFSAGRTSRIAEAGYCNRLLTRGNKVVDADVLEHGLHVGMHAESSMGVDFELDRCESERSRSVCRRDDDGARHSD